MGIYPTCNPTLKSARRIQLIKSYHLNRNCQDRFEIFDLCSHRSGISDIYRFAPLGSQKIWTLHYLRSGYLIFDLAIYIASPFILFHRHQEQTPTVAFLLRELADIELLLGALHYVPVRMNHKMPSRISQLSRRGLLRSSGRFGGSGISCLMIPHCSSVRSIGSLPFGI